MAKYSKISDFRFRISNFSGTLPPIGFKVIMVYSLSIFIFKALNCCLQARYLSVLKTNFYETHIHLPAFVGRFKFI